MKKDIINKQLYHFAGHSIAYEYCQFNVKSDVTVIFVHGLRATPWGRKGDTIKETCKELGINFLRFDLLGHGDDTDNFLLCDFNSWKQQIQTIIKRYIHNNIIMVGTCVGGWLSLCTAEKFPNRIKSVICLSVAPDLIEQMLLRATPEQIKCLEDTGFVEARIEKYHYIFSQNLWTSFLSNNLLKQDKINITCPVYLLQGQDDVFIDWHSVLKVCEKLASTQVVMKILKKSNHHMQDKEALLELKRSLQDAYAKIQKEG